MPVEVNEEKYIKVGIQKILMIAPFPPLPNSGGGIAIFGDLYELTRRGIGVDVVCFQGNYSQQSADSLRAICRKLILVEGPRAYSPQIVLNAIWQQQPTVVARHNSSQMRNTLANLLSENSYDAILVEFSFMFQYFIKNNFEFAKQHPLLVVEHLVVTPKVYEYFNRIETNPVLRLFRKFEIPRLKKYLKNVLIVADKHLFLGLEDLQYVRSQVFDPTIENKLIYRPVGLLQERYPLADPAKVEPYTIGFFGSFDWKANVDAVTHFVEDIFPLIFQKLPQVKFVIAGRAAPAQIRSLSKHPSIEFVGEVDNMFNVVQRVAVIIVPLRIGAGTRLKILEAMAWGKPIISTSIGVEGIEYTDNEEIIVKDTPLSFAEATLILLNDPEQQHKLAKAGRRRIESTYTTQHSVNRLQQVLNSTELHNRE
jgi:glycosyltransferase involved in cell wall biosynthesis